MKKKKQQQQKRKVAKTKNNSKKKSPKDIFLDNFCGETGFSRDEAIVRFGGLDHGRMMYKHDYEKTSLLDFLFKRTIESLVK